MFLPIPQHSSGAAVNRLDEGYLKIALLLQMEAIELVARELSRMTKAAGYLKANFTADALARGPIRR